MNDHALGRASTLSALLVSGLVLVGVFAGCGSKSANERPVVALITDVSGSTKALRVSGGEFDKGIKEAIQQTALSEGQLWARPVAAQAVASGTWVIEGDGSGEGNFQKGSGGASYEESVLENKAQEVAKSPAGKELLKSIKRTGGTKNCGSDLLGAILQAAKIFSDYPDSPKALVLLTDGGVCSRGVNLASDPPATSDAQAQLVTKLRKSGEVKRDALAGVVVWAGGVGRGLTGNDGRDATAVSSLWDLIIKANGGKIGDVDTSLNLTGFPPK